ncbi:ArnT family glycosyltransferase [Sinomonas terrae]|uniref:Glycosyltransferase family 39 protein n=1 Tax=Sinomonas terrae TaxID=2908838 RepID=A0ABS9TYW7_9MICC|nr:glycosyltransferase family 39 protein [Sinomonas terrae]MCH6469362.1 glycosyltransferase family 39 protein [Sinomonas terrae]
MSSPRTARVIPVSTNVQQALVRDRRTARERWLFKGLLVLTAAAYLWDLPLNGWANPYYAAAAQAASQDWGSFLFGSLDWGNAITVDKPPLALWPMALSIKTFGLAPWSLLAPQALLGTATVALVFAAVRRVFPATIAFVAAILCGTTPVFFLMSRYDNPEPMMGFMTAAGFYAAIRAGTKGSWRWYLLCGTSFGLAFLTKQFQGLIPVPALAFALLLLGAGNVRDRLIKLLAALAALVASAGWWVAVVELTPSSQRPYVGGSQSNSVLDLAFGYNGLGRITQGDGSLGSAASVGTPYDGGFSRLFNADFAPEIGWLLPTALISLLLVAALNKSFVSRQERLMALAAAMWLTLAWLLLSFMASSGHPYYTYSLAIPESVVIAIVFRLIWLRSHAPIGRLFGVVLLVSTGYMGVRVMQYSDTWAWWMPLALMCLSLIASARWLLLAPQGRPGVTWALVIASLVSGQLASDIVTASHPITGTQPTSGPVGRDPNSISRLIQSIRSNQEPNWVAHISEGVAPSARMLQTLGTGNSSSKWLAATFPAEDAALIQLTTGRPIMAIGGWAGHDPSPTLERFKALVSAGQVQFFVDHPSMADFGLGSEASDIAGWVKSTYKGQPIDDAVIYMLTPGNLR